MLAFAAAPVSCHLHVHTGHARCGHGARARVSDSHPRYRRVALAATKAETHAPSTAQDLRRYAVRVAQASELYTVADIRCEAFYGSPKDPYYYPVRRREIYMAMRDRVDAGNRCLVVVDKTPDEKWLPFCAADGSLVVGSLDASLHAGGSGRRCRFPPPPRREERVEGDDLRRIYISSMAVREEWQNRGLAQRLLTMVDEIASQQGISEVFLHVDWENAPAVHLYQKCGFECPQPNESALRVPNWLSFLAKREHTLMRKLL